MYYSAIGALAILILLIENRDVFLNRRGAFETPVWRVYRRFLFAVLVYYLSDVAWGLLESHRLSALLFAGCAGNAAPEESMPPESASPAPFSDTEISSGIQTGKDAEAAAAVLGTWSLDKAEVKEEDAEEFKPAEVENIADYEKEARYADLLGCEGWKLTGEP